MIKAQLMDGEVPAAILALMAVASQDIATIQMDPLPGQAIVTQQPNHAGNLDLEIDRADPIFMGLLEMGPMLAGLQPRIEGVVRERSFVAGMDDLGQFPAQQGKSPADTDHMNRHIKPVEHQDAGV
jgi:hypothetical protein